MNTRHLIASALALVLLATAGIAQTVSAVLEPLQLVEIRSSVNGRLDVIDVKEGDIVAKDTLLATIDARVQRARVALSKVTADGTAALERADIAIEQARAMQKRVANARSKGAAQEWEVTQSQQAMQLAQADRKLAVEGIARNEAQLDLEQATLSEFEMRAPFDGTILQVFTEAGEIIDTQKTVLEIGNLDRLRATAFVPLDWLDTLSVGTEISAQVQNDTGTTSARVTSIDPRIDPASLSVRVRFEFDNPDRSLLAGTVVTISRP